MNLVLLTKRIFQELFIIYYDLLFIMILWNAIITYYI